MKRYHIIGSCHTDLAWKGGEEQYAVYLEQFVVLMLDLLEQFPEFTYIIEQAYHYRSLEARRPDLIEKLKRYIAEGRIEVVGGMISTMDTNMPCPESNVRNQLLGIRWFEKHLGAKIQTGWMYDAFGCHAQTPQLIASFGMKHMMGSRFGGNKRHDIFEAEGLDGTRMLTAGHDCFSPDLPADEDLRVFVGFVPLTEQVDALFEKAKKTKLQGPLMVLASIEDESFPSRHLLEAARRLGEYLAARGDELCFSVPHRFFEEVDSENIEFPVESADMNPEFTGTYTQRIGIRMLNRKTETELLDAEKWLALYGKEWPWALHDAWWDMGFVHFHDVFTGSHPERVFDDVMRRLENVRSLAKNTLEDIFGTSAGERTGRIRVVNGLPFARNEWVSVPFSGSGAKVKGADGTEIPGLVRDGRLWFPARAGACAASDYVIEEAEADPPLEEYCTSAVLENSKLQLTIDCEKGISLKHKASGRVLLDAVRDFLVLQGDTGSYQIEKIEGPEIPAFAFPVKVIKIGESLVRVSGAFKDPEGAVQAEWTLDFTLWPDDDHIGVNVRINWKASGMRLRVKLASSLTGAGEGIYEIPFGTVRRPSYTPAFNRKGEWPVQRFCAVEDGRSGIALINDGVPGAEITGGTLYSTILRAPVSEYAGMVPDESSLQHGIHEFRFALYPYAGKWQQSDVLELAQRWNQPLKIYEASGKPVLRSFLSIDSTKILLYAVKLPEEGGSGEIVVRMGEGIGERQRCTLEVSGAVRAWDADMRENKREEITVEDHKIVLDLKPWQIRTLIVKREMDP